MDDAGGHPGGPAVHGVRPRGAGLPGHLPGTPAVPAGALPHDVRQPAVDDPAVRGLLHRRRLERLLPAQPRGRAEGPVDRLRPGHPPRLRLRQPARRRRRGHGGCGDRLDPGHASAVRRHPAGPHERVDDHERRRAAGDGALRGRCAGAGRGARGAHGHDPERRAQGVHGPQHLHLPARPVDADHQRRLRVHLGADAAVQLDLHLGLPHAGGRRDGRPGAGLHAGRRPGVPAGRRRGGAGHRPVRAAHLVLLGHRASRSSGPSA